ncbi:glycosyltransferase family 4 protein [Cyanobium sp. AMD-g]|uniref:glycosyltransferase family 4 protein n=1 Tax=Cyanobium sp. AMD-g TaxID=2823699 RepID=UPI0020CD077E|nr:glycosyltransferase family 1 protein [Cyanobium sp. AMD-g]MCP9929765.1 glycosyltransferase family 4 protein [Cyanobium sp. AMD-g]
MINHSILVIGNYPADHQQSMLRVARLLVRVYDRNGQSVKLACPPVVLARLPYLPLVAKKYIAYVDKLFLFPLWLWLRRRRFDLVHIADHSNAFYSFCLPRSTTIVNCHDLLAVRGAMGDPSAACEPSVIGLWLQRLIMAGLRRAGAVAFISKATSDDYLRLIGCPAGQRHAVIHLPLNAPFLPGADGLLLATREKAKLPSFPFLLMVGSALPRKNRSLALKLFSRIAASTSFHLVFAGERLSAVEQAFRDSHPYGSRLLSIVAPSQALLNVLYCQAHALLFPSLAEGFGWPLIEAQACGCPVIASTTTSIPEVAGDGALYADPYDVALFAEHVIALENPSQRAELIQLGFANVARFTFDGFSQATSAFALQQ